MVDGQNTWTEEDSDLYRQIAVVAVPARDEQIATLLTLLPFDQHETFRAVELGCGEGALAFALLDCFPHASLVALDGSPAMRVHAAERLRPFGPRLCVDPFDLTSMTWLPRLQSADCVLSSLCVHHLSGRQKQQLFTAISRQLSPRGVFLIADLVEPQRPEACRLFAATWDRLAEAQSILQTGSLHLYEVFRKEQWNYYHFPEDPIDQPSPLFDQLTWLKTARFAVVDCFWLQAGHAIYGGYKVRTTTPSTHHLPFATALRSAQAGLRATARTAEGYSNKR